MKRIGMWLVEVIEDTFPVTYQGCLSRESISGQELTLQLLANALTKVKNLEIKMESIEMYFDCQMVESAFLNEWLEKWSVSDWTSAKGKEIADKDTWMLIWKLLSSIGKRYIVMQDKSRYADWMRWQIEDEQKKIKNKEVAAQSVEKVMKMLS